MFLNTVEAILVSLAVSSFSFALNVRHYGAKGDGITDDHAAIQAAIDSLKGKGGAVHFPASTLCYMTSSQILLQGDEYSNIVLEGDGFGSCLKASAPIGYGGHGNTGLIWFHGSGFYSLQNVGIRHLRISGFDETTGTAGPLISFSNTSGSFITDSFADTNRNEAFYWNASRDSRNATIRGNFVTHVGGWGSDSTNGYRAAYNPNVSGLIMTDNRAFEVGMAVEQTGDNAIISNNVFESIALNKGATYTPALSLQSTAVGFSKMLIHHNIIRFAGRAISISGAGNAGEDIIDSNIIDHCDSGIQAFSKTLPIIVRGNFLYDTISKSQGSGIIMRGIGGIVENNMFTLGSVPWAYLINFAEESSGVARNNIAYGDSVTTGYFVSTSSNDVQWIGNTIEGASRENTPVYRFNGALLSKKDVSGLWVGPVTLSNQQPSSAPGSSAPSKGTWKIGDVVLNNDLNNVVYGWICTTAGTPGIWTVVSVR